MADEFYTPKEEKSLPDEFHSQYTHEITTQDEEFNKVIKEVSPQPKKSAMDKLKKMGYLVAACVTVVTVGAAAGEVPNIINDISDTVSIVTSVDEPVISDKPIVVEDDSVKDIADKAFPLLNNLEPNGYVEGYGILDQEFVYLENAKNQSVYPLWVGKNRTSDSFYSLYETDGARYDKKTNTVYLDNFKDKECILNANMMGNSFTLNVSGDCELEAILIWGFYYGGSLTITGNGNLHIIGEDNIGILLNAEQSPSCLMIDSGVTLTVDSSSIAVRVWATTMEKAIYYLEPLKLEGGYRDYSGKFDIETIHITDIYNDDNYVDEETLPVSKHVVWSK